MDDNISFTVKLMLLVTIKTASLQPPGGVVNDSWRMPVGFLAPSDHRGVRKPTVDAQLRLWDTAGWCNYLKNCDFGQGVFSC